ncbi:hypothetical protein Tco_0972183 [Tanacetum coccineum]
MSPMSLSFYIRRSKRMNQLCCRSSSTPIYSPGASRDAECSNCKHLLDKITVLEAMVEMYKNPEQNTLNSAALLHEVYNDMGKLDLE